MSHEHHDCSEHEHMYQLAEEVGRMCLAGHCQHPEHQNIQAILDQHYLTEQLANENTVVTPEIKTKQSKKKKKYAPLLGQLIAGVA